MARKIDWVVNVQNELVNKMDENTSKQTKRWKNQSIYKVPPCVITDQNKKAYMPQVVSLGPYHHDDNHLKPMEIHKDRALLQFLKRSKQSLETIHRTFSEMVESLKDNYGSIGKYGNDEFLKMMILDGCFLIEILLAWDFTKATTPTGYSESDPIFSEHGKLYVVPFIRRDMLMLENQLPMIVLDTLGSCCGDDRYINKLILNFYGISEPSKTIGKCLHVLEVVHKSMIVEDPPSPRGKIMDMPTGKNIGTENSKIVLSAIELEEAGINFRKSNSQSLRDISFQGGTVRLPYIVIDDNTESTFLNLIAFERCHVGVGNAITSYICFMDSLIDSGKDINLLHTNEIVSNVMGSNKAAANLFNTMSMDLMIDQNSAISKVNWMINIYCKKCFNKNRARFCRTYCTSPWATISVIAAIVLFTLAILQTAYSIAGYHK